MIGFACSAAWYQLSRKRVVEPTILIDPSRIIAITVNDERTILFGIFTIKPKMEMFVEGNRFVCTFDDDDSMYQIVEILIKKTKGKVANADEEQPRHNLLDVEIDDIFPS